LFACAGLASVEILTISVSDTQGGKGNIMIQIAKRDGRVPKIFLQWPK
jgi:hypothetical protein